MSAQHKYMPVCVYNMNGCFIMCSKDPLNVSDLPAVVSSVPPEPQCAGPPGTVACCPQWKHFPGGAARSYSGLPTSSGLHYLFGQLLGLKRKKGLGEHFSYSQSSSSYYYCCDRIYSEIHQLSLILCLSSATSLSSYTNTTHTHTLNKCAFAKTLISFTVNPLLLHLAWVCGR